MTLRGDLLFCDKKQVLKCVDASASFCETYISCCVTILEVNYASFPEGFPESTVHGTFAQLRRSGNITSFSACKERRLYKNSSKKRPTYPAMKLLRKQTSTLKVSTTFSKRRRIRLTRKEKRSMRRRRIDFFFFSAWPDWCVLHVQ